jgi:hypothetical protein
MERFLLNCHDCRLGDDLSLAARHQEALERVEEQRQNDEVDGRRSERR